MCASEGIGAGKQQVRRGALEKKEIGADRWREAKIQQVRESPVVSKREGAGGAWVATVFQSPACSSRDP